MVGSPRDLTDFVLIEGREDGEAFFGGRGNGNEERMVPLKEKCYSERVISHQKLF